MTRTGWGLGLAVLVLATSCISQPSLQPLFTEDDATAVPQALGHWIQEKELGGGDRVEIDLRSGKDGCLTMLLQADGPPASFEVRFGRLGEDLFWDTVALPRDDEGAFYTLHRLPVHGFARVRVEPDRLEVAVLDSDWIEDLHRSGRLEIAHEIVDGVVVLTATTADLQRFLADHAGDPEAFEAPRVFRLAPAERGELPAPAVGW